MTTLLIITALIVAFLVAGKLKSKKTDEDDSIFIEIKKQATIRNLLKRANEKQIVKDYKSAVAIADKVLLIDQDNYLALTCRASSLEALNFNLDAIEDYEKALELNNSDGNIYGLLGLAYLKIGEIDKGLKNLNLSIQKGLKIYEMQYEIFSSLDEDAIQERIKRSKITERLQRRNREDFTDNLSTTDKNAFNEALRNQIHNLERTISLDPENTELKKLYEIVKKHLD